MEALQEEIQYDQYGRMKYNPEFHPNHRKPFSESELEYLCKYWDFDSRKDMSFALGKTETSLAATVYVLQKNDQFEYYKNLNKFW